MSSGRITSCRARRLIAGATLVALLGLAGMASVSTAQPPAPPTSTPAATAGPPPDISGQWSITRTWFRRCPRCGLPVIRTSPWVIRQTGQDVRIDRGLRGTIVGAPGGGGYLALSGTESDGFDVLRFWYSTLYVSPSGGTFEGQFGGSETIQNPCGEDPPIVTCLVSAGWIRGQRLNPIATQATPAASATPPTFPTPGNATPTLTMTATPIGPTGTPSRLPSASPTPTVRPLQPLYLPAAQG